MSPALRVALRPTVVAEQARAGANSIACALHGWWCARLGRPLRR